MSDVRAIHVFIASPGDLAVERRAFKTVIDNLNDGFGDGAGVKFAGLGWEDTLASTGRRAQSVINQDIDRADVFILAMHRRWGQEAPDAQPYSSYTEEEFHRALERWSNEPERGQRRSPEIFVFFKHIDPASMADPGPQLQRVLDFRRALEESRQVLYRLFSDETEFSKLLDRHLRAFAKGQLPEASTPHEPVVLPLKYLDAVEREKTERRKAEDLAADLKRVADIAAARAERLALELAEYAARAAAKGSLEDARQAFAKAQDGTTNSRILLLAFTFYFQVNAVESAAQMAARWLAINRDDHKSPEAAYVYCSLGLIYLAKRDLRGAEEVLCKAMSINEMLGNHLEMVVAAGELGVVYVISGELETAERMLRKAIAVAAKLGHPESATKYSAILKFTCEVRGRVVPGLWDERE